MLPSTTPPQTFTLTNGLRVVLDPMPALYSVAVNLWVDASSPHPELPYQAGMSHFLEHLLFKGLLESPYANHLAQIENTGGRINALTDKETTCFYARVLSDQLNTVLSVFHHLLTHPLFHETHVDTERQVILEEVMKNNRPSESYLLQRLTQHLWQGHPLAEAVAGNPDAVKRITYEDLIASYHHDYQPGRLILSIAGQFDVQQTRQEIEQLFGNLEKHSPALPAPERFPVYHQSHIHEFYPSEPAYICLANQGPSAGDPDRYGLSLLDSILTGGIGSRLFKVLRDKTGLVYSANCFELLYRHGGLYGLYAQTQSDNLTTVYTNILETFDSLIQEGPTADELHQAQQRILGNLMLNMESPQYRAARNGRALLYQGEPIPVESSKTALHAITTQSLQDLCQKLLQKEQLSCLVIGQKSLNFHDSGKTLPV